MECAITPGKQLNLDREVFLRGIRKVLFSAGKAADKAQYRNVRIKAADRTVRFVARNNQQFAVLDITGNDDLFASDPDNVVFLIPREHIPFLLDAVSSSQDRQVTITSSSDGWQLMVGTSDMTAIICDIHPDLLILGESLFLSATPIWRLTSRISDWRHIVKAVKAVGSEDKGKADSPGDTAKVSVNFTTRCIHVEARNKKGSCQRMVPILDSQTSVSETVFMADKSFFYDIVVLAEDEGFVQLECVETHGKTIILVRFYSDRLVGVGCDLVRYDDELQLDESFCIFRSVRAKIPAERQAPSEEAAETGSDDGQEAAPRGPQSSGSPDPCSSDSPASAGTDGADPVTGNGSAGTVVSETPDGPVQTPLRYYGGKKAMVKDLLPLVPPHDCYVELCGGAGSFLFAKEPAKIEVFNDIDLDIIRFFKIARDPVNGPRLVRALNLTPYHVYEHELGQNRTDDMDDVEWARRLFCDDRMSYNGHLGGSFSRCNTANVAPKYFKTVNRLDRIRHRLSNVVFENGDFATVIAKYDTQDTFFFFDPPYLPSTRRTPNAYRYEMSEGDHIRLLNVVKGVKGKVMLCGYRSPLYGEHLRGWHVREFQVRCAADTRTGSRGYRTEVVWMNYEPPAVAETTAITAA
jgi:DNA adenine methylase